MLRSRLKALLIKAEKLRVDTQPIRSLLSCDVIDSRYDNVVLNLEREVMKYPPNSQPHSVQMLINRLKPRPSSRKFREKDVNISTENYVMQGQNISELVKAQSQILEQLKNMNDELNRLRSGGSLIEEVDPDLPQIEDVFVNPIDEEEVKAVKGHIKVVPEKTTSMSKALKNLRQLRKGK